jgi:hypothetical protein
VVAFRGSSKNTRKLNLQSVLDIELFLTHTKSKFDVLGIVRKLVKDVVHPWWQNLEKNI